MNDDNTYVVTDTSGKAIGRKYHIGNGCPTFTDTPNYVQVSTHEIGLLGLKLCAVCEKRKSGGPAIDVLEGFFGEDWPFADGWGAPRDGAWALLDYLKDHNGYIAFRKPKGDS